MLKKKVLVTGASGMLGQVLSEHLSDDYDVVCVSKTGRGNTHRLDLADEKAVADFCRSARPDTVIHTAAYSDVDGCERDPKLAQESNALGTKNLISALAGAACPFLYVSTDYVFDGRKRSPYTENETVFPVNIYGMTKLEGEYYVRGYPGPSAIVRPSWLFGRGNVKNFVNVIIDRLRREASVSVLADQENSPTYVVDLSQALGRIARYLADPRPANAGAPVCEIFHFCNAGSTTRYGMTLKIKELLGLNDVRVERGNRSAMTERVAVRPAHTVMSTKRYEDFFNVKIRRWEESLKEYLAGGCL
jgi:dTDP-4-dehydrorhamnose reductase